MVNMATLEVNGSLAFDYSIIAVLTVGACTVGLELCFIIFDQFSMKRKLDEVGCNIEDINWMRQVGEYICKCIWHFATHIKIFIFVLKEIDGVLNRTSWGKIFHNFSIDEKEYF